MKGRGKAIRGQRKKLCLMGETSMRGKEDNRGEQAWECNGERIALKTIDGGELAWEGMNQKERTLDGRGGVSSLKEHKSDVEGGGLREKHI